MANIKPKIVLSDLTYDNQEERAVLSVLRSRWISLGQECQKLEKEFSAYIGVSNALAVTNGTAALHLAFASLNIGQGDEVIVPSLTFVATANAVRYTGATPVFADVSSLDDLTISSKDIERKITKRTKAICVVHYAGYPCNMDAIKSIAKKFKLYVIEDAAHGPGSYYNGKQIGTLADIGCFSFYANKNLATGEGGMIVTDNTDLATRIKYLRSHGMTTIAWDRHKGRAYNYDVLMLGYNYRFDEIRAALGRIQLAKLTKNNKKRGRLNTHYVNLLKTVKKVKIPFLNRKEIVSHHIFPILLESNVNRIKLMAALASEGIQTSIHYPPVHSMSIYLDSHKTELPFTQIVGEHELTLPMHPRLEFKDIERVVDVLKYSLDNIQ